MLHLSRDGYTGNDRGITGTAQGMYRERRGDAQGIDRG